MATANSVQNANEEADEKFSYDEVLMVLNEISKYKDVLKSDLGEEGEYFCSELDKAIDAVENKQKPSRIKRVLGTLKDFVIGVSGSLAASGVLALINTIPNVGEI